MGRGEWRPFQNDGLWDICVACWREGKTGILVVDHAGKLRTLQFQRGQIVTADSEDPEDNLVQVFLDRECFSLENYLQVSANFREDQGLGESMVQFGLITKAELVEGRQAQVYRVFTNTIRLPDGRYRFDSTQPTAISAGPCLAFPKDFFRAFLEIDNREWVLDHMSARLAFRVAPLEPIPASVWEANAMKDLASVKDLLAEQLDFKTLVLASSTEDFRLLKFLRMAEMLGYVTLVPTGDEDVQPDEPIDLPQALAPSMPAHPPEMDLPPPKPSSGRWAWLLAGGLGLATVLLLVWAGLGHADAEPEVEPEVEPAADIQLTGEADPGDSQPLDLPKPTAAKIQAYNSPTAAAMARGDIDKAAMLWHDESAAWSDQFTLGIYMVCDPANAFKLWRLFPDDKRLFILPHQFKDRSCYWVCWGQFATRLEALTARETLPQAVLDESSDAEVYPLEKLR